MLGLPHVPGWCRGLNVEPLQYVELSHVLHVLFFRELKSFHDHRRTGPGRLGRTWLGV